MAHINLLPWREELRKQRQREFVGIAAGSAVVTLLVVAYFHLSIGAMIDAQNGRNDFLARNIQEVEGKLSEITDLEKQKQELVARMEVIERLQRNRPEIVHLFDELAKSTPDGLYLTALKQSGDKITIEGHAQSNARVSAFMRNLDNSKWFQEPILEVIQAKEAGTDQAHKFVLTVKQQPTGGEANGDGV